MLYTSQGKYDEAELLCAKASGIAEKTFVLKHPIVKKFAESFFSVIVKSVNQSTSNENKK